MRNRKQKHTLKVFQIMILGVLLGVSIFLGVSNSATLLDCFYIIISAVFGSILVAIVSDYLLENQQDMAEQRIIFEKKVKLYEDYILMFEKLNVFDPIECRRLLTHLSNIRIHTKAENLQKILEITNNIITALRVEYILKTQAEYDDFKSIFQKYELEFNDNVSLPMNCDLLLNMNLSAQDEQCVKQFKADFENNQNSYPKTAIMLNELSIIFQWELYGDDNRMGRLPKESYDHIGSIIKQLNSR